MMKNLIFLVPLLLLMACAPSEDNAGMGGTLLLSSRKVETTVLPGDSVKFQELEPGLEFFQGEVTVGQQQVMFNLVRVNPDEHPTNIVASYHAKLVGHTIPVYQEQQNAKVVLSGGFLKSFSPLPLGLVKSGAKLLNRAHEGNDDLLNGLLRVRDGRPEIVKFRGVEMVAEWDAALQSGPLLASGGRSALPNEDQRLSLSRQMQILIEKANSRAFIAIDKEGRVLLAITGELSLPVLVEFLIWPTSQGGLGCETALNLSGSGNQALLLKTGQEKMGFGATHQRFPNAIVILN